MAFNFMLFFFFMLNSFKYLNTFWYSNILSLFFYSLRIAYFHEACEVRAAVLRACRYLLENLETLEAFLQTKLHLFVSRSLDISLDNRIERVQALRLMRKVLDLNPSGFPRAFSNCLVSIVNEGSQERDMIRPCLATLAQLGVCCLIYIF